MPVAEIARSHGKGRRAGCSGKVAQLTSGIVWLVEKILTLPNGQTTRSNLSPSEYE